MDCTHKAQIAEWIFRMSASFPDLFIRSKFSACTGYSGYIEVIDKIYPPEHTSYSHLMASMFKDAKTLYFAWSQATSIEVFVSSMETHALLLDEDLDPLLKEDLLDKARNLLENALHLMEAFFMDYFPLSTAPAQPCPFRQLSLFFTGLRDGELRVEELPGFLRH